ncbi:MAG: CcmD family protein [Bacteroidia bacterium]
MKTLRLIFPSLLLLILPLITQAQTDQVEMADLMHRDGKIYVVIGVLSIVLAGILVYLIMIDRKLKKLENKDKS